MNGEDNSNIVTNLSADQVRDRALTKLIPLLDEIDASPERKFDLCMSALRATDTPQLLQKALTFAEQITDKAEQAQALIDVANEATVRIQTTTNVQSANA
jgi:hypothetical protein